MLGSKRSLNTVVYPYRATELDTDGVGRVDGQPGNRWRQKVKGSREKAPLTKPSYLEEALIRSLARSVRSSPSGRLCAALTF